jgi:predicted RND superfamily exporter protein
MKKFSLWIITYPKTVIVLTCLLTVFFATGLPKIRIDDNLKDMLPEDMPVRQALNKIDDIFGGSDAIIIAIGKPEGNIFNQGTLSKIMEITKMVETIPGIYDVISLATAKQIEGKEWGIEVTPFMETVPETETEIATLRQRFFDDETYVGQLVSIDGKFAAIIASVAKDADEFKIYEEIKQMSATMNEPEQIHLAGFPVLRAAIADNIKSDLRRLIPFVLLVVIGILYLSFRRLDGVLLPLLVVICATIATVGLMGHLHQPFTTLTNTLPVMLIAIGIAYGIHVIAKYHEERAAGLEKKDALAKTIREICIPVIMAGLTTMAGFMSLVTAPLPEYTNYGVFAAFGVFMALLLALTMIPALLMVLPAPRNRPNPVNTRFLRSETLTGVDRFVTWLAGSVLRFNRFILAGSVMLAIVLGIGIFWVIPEMNPITFFQKDHALCQADALVNEYLGGSVNMSFLFSDDIGAPDVLQQMEAIQNFLKRLPDTGSTMSIATIIKKINRAMNENKPEFEVLPETREAIAQAILMYSMSGSPQDFERFVDNPFAHAQVVARMKSGSTLHINKITRAAEQYCATPEFRKSTGDAGQNTVEITGFSVLLKDLTFLVTQGVGISFVVSLLLIFLMAWITYRALKIACLAVIPLTITILICFGVMGYTGIPLSIPIAVLTNIVIGCGIDYSFHFLSRLQLERQRDQVEHPIARTIKSVGKPIIYNATSVALGFLVLMFSGLLPVQFLGFLIALAMLGCGFGALTVLASAVSFREQQRPVRRC